MSSFKKNIGNVQHLYNKFAKQCYSQPYGYFFKDTVILTTNKDLYKTLMDNDQATALWERNNRYPVDLQQLGFNLSPTTSLNANCENGIFVTRRTAHNNIESTLVFITNPKSLDRLNEIWKTITSEHKRYIQSLNIDFSNSHEHFPTLFYCAKIADGSTIEGTFQTPKKFNNAPTFFDSMIELAKIKYNSEQTENE